MNYTEFRQAFDTDAEFREALGKLTEAEAKALISAGDQPTLIKACEMTTWRSAREEYLKSAGQTIPVQSSENI